MGNAERTDKENNKKGGLTRLGFVGICVLFSTALLIFAEVLEPLGVEVVNPLWGATFVFTAFLRLVEAPQGFNGGSKFLGVFRALVFWLGAAASAVAFAAVCAAVLAGFSTGFDLMQDVELEWLRPWAIGAPVGAMLMHVKPPLIGEKRFTLRVRTLAVLVGLMQFTCAVAMLWLMSMFTDGGIEIRQSLLAWNVVGLSGIALLTVMRKPSRDGD